MSNIFDNKEIDGVQLEQLLEERKTNKKSFILVDVREEYEFNSSHIEGVDYLIPLSSFYEKVKEIEGYKETPVIMQCKLGGRSQQAQRQLETMGFKRVINLAGGISAYKGKTINA
tara:strand:+ start:759 stop:1103 length:345 start_codon:yes stop_codon:yes gene_type:complete